MALSSVVKINPVKATVVAPFGDFKENDEIVINRVTNGATMFGVSGMPKFLPSVKVDEEARRRVLHRYRRVQQMGQPPAFL